MIVFRVSGFIMDPVISTFPKILYTSDVMDALKRCWDEKNKRELKRSQRRDGAHMRRFFREVYMESVFPILNSAELPPYIWGNDEREKERLLWILNHCDKRTAIESLLSPDRLYKPFNVDRLTLKTRGNLTLEKTRFLVILQKTLSKDSTRIKLNSMFLD